MHKDRSLFFLQFFAKKRKKLLQIRLILPMGTQKRDFIGCLKEELREWFGHSDVSTTSNIDTHLGFRSRIASAKAILGVYPG